jgi:aspartate/methionine/tyrosine aminotransferase
MAQFPALSDGARTLRESIFARLAGRLSRHGSDGVPLHLGDTFVTPPLEVLVDSAGGLGASLDPALLRYGWPAGEPELVRALVDKLQRDNGLGWVEPQHLAVTVGGTGALSAAVRTLLDPGDEVLLPSPHWPLIRGILTTAGVVPVEVPLSQRLYADPGLDPAEILDSAVTSRTRALYLTTPNNPDGKVLSSVQLESIATLARDRGLWVLADEAYEALLYDGRTHVSIASVADLAERTVTAMTLSKSYALAGLRLGYLVGPAPVVAAARKVANHTVYNVPDVLQRAARALVTDPGRPAWLDETRALYDRLRRLASAGLPLPHALPEGASYLFVDVSSAMRPEESTVWPLVEELIDEGVSVSPGEQFGRGYERYVRLCFTAVPPERLEVGMERIRRVLSRRL